MKFGLWALVLLVSGLSRIALADPGDDRILMAREAASRGDVARLASLGATPSDHVLEPYIQYWALSARISRSSDIVSPDEVQAFLSANTGSYLAERLRGEWLRRLGSEQRWSEFDAGYGLMQQPDQSTQCYAIQSNAPGADAARAALATQWQTLLDVPAGCDQPLQSLLANGRVSIEDGWQRFRRLVEAKRFTGARNVLVWMPSGQTPGSTAVTSALENPARYLAGTPATRSRADRELALAAIARMARSDVVAAAARWNAIDTADFSAEEKAYAWGQLGWMGALRQMPEAATWFKRARGTTMNADQRNWSVRAHLRIRDWAGVREAIKALPPEQQDTPDWTYWMARAEQEQGHAEAASRLYQRHADTPTFYGILSTEALGRVYAWPQAAAPATAAELERVRQDPGLQRAEALYRLEMRLEGTREWNWAIRGADDRFLLAAAERARQIGLYDRAINTAERTRNEHDYGLRYLAPYYEAFSRNADVQGLDLAWVYGLVRQESRFLSVARSGVGAQGLMQVMPATGKWIAGKQGWGDYQPAWLNGIDTNVRVGSAYLRHVLDTLSNHRVLATAAYNAGPSRARRWRDAAPIEGAIYAETIPFTETREYVKKVMANAELYSQLFDKRPISLGSRLGTIPSSAVAQPLAAGEP